MDRRNPKIKVRQQRANQVTQAEEQRRGNVLKTEPWKQKSDHQTQSIGIYNEQILVNVYHPEFDAEHEHRTTAAMMAGQRIGKNNPAQRAGEETSSPSIVKEFSIRGLITKWFQRGF